MIVKFENTELNVIEDAQHEWLLSTDLVAKGYGVSIDAILKHKQRRNSELIEGKHYLKEVDNLSTHPAQIFWTKRGVVRLGFFIRSKQAVAFRDFAEDLVINKIEQKPLSQIEILQQSVNMLVEHDREIKEVKGKVLELEAKTQTRPDYFTIVGYGTLKGINVNMTMASKLGGRASRLCKQRGIEIDKTPDPRFGQVGMYPKTILEEVFNQSL